MEQICFSAPEPYPKTEAARPDTAFAKKLLFAYASKDSEMSAVTSYCYRATVLERRCPELSKIMSGVAKIEMLHLSILARLIFFLGYDPKYRLLQGNDPNFWDGGFVSYKKDPESILRASIEEEKGAHKGYLELAEQTCDRAVQKILLRLALDEKLHTEIFEKELRALKKTAVRR